ncbi:MAG: hypothetical protein LBV69_04395, partial [Bacteroidales bacterium]|nr:hypothetical protein [Bacteroidales bacterium]
MSDDQRNSRNWLQFFFGKYTLPGFIPALGRLIQKAGDGFLKSSKAHKVRYLIIYALIVLSAGVFFWFRTMESRKPQPIYIDYSVRPPENISDPEYRT